ncbi:hypothetical protein IWX90DRAFT_262410 [Phyllosticta citrichinensis]|uniref:BZIP domain-containing protein n=1 Tax=Phyllosticta citrichinensis TaxID=1130410 RepID=A0ABR1XSL6_9PEZI
MPPVRTLATAKPVKTERTHEENQERAYIAASRRSDRSLEARIESARRASEIHKKRTGRALRVTEQDVVNEEMYEEEDDDLPAQYRRLTAHLQTNSVDFNRKLQAYLATHQAGRQALMDPSSMMGAFGQPYPNAPHFAPQFMYQQPYQMLPPQMIHRSPQSFRQAPYPSPQTAQKPQQRAASIATPQDASHQQSTGPPQGRSDSAPDRDEQQRRMSMPAQSIRSPSMPSNAPQTQANVSRPPTSSPDASKDQAQNLSYPTGSSTPATPPPQQPLFSSPGMPFGMEPTSMPHMPSTSPFSMALPAETQQMLGPTLDPNNPQTALFMANSEMLPQFTQYTYNPNFDNLKARMNSATQGMNQTLAPSSAPEMGINPESLSFGTTGADAMAPGAYSSSLYGYDAMNSGLGYGMSRDDSQQESNSGLLTPGNEWAKFIDGTMFEEFSSSQP